MALSPVALEPKPAARALAPDAVGAARPWTLLVRTGPSAPVCRLAVIDETAVSDEEMTEIDAAVTADWLASDEDRPDTDEVSVEIVEDVVTDSLASDEDIPETDEVSVEIVDDTTSDWLASDDDSTETWLPIEVDSELI
jgi:hypothetical protein